MPSLPGPGPPRPSTCCCCRPSAAGTLPSEAPTSWPSRAFRRPLRAAVVDSQRQSWTYTEIEFLDGRSTPGLIVGAPLLVPTVGPYELYYLFPLNAGAVHARPGAQLRRLHRDPAGPPSRPGSRGWSPGRSSCRCALRRRPPSGWLGGQPVRANEGEGHRRPRPAGQRRSTRWRSAWPVRSASWRNCPRVQQRFVSDVSHELRTPLTTIRMAADVVYDDRDQLDAPVARAVELLQNQLDRFEALLVDLLEISRFDAGAAVLDVERDDLTTLVQRAIDAATPLAERGGMQVRLWAGQTDMCQVECDPRRVHRIVRNLIENAIEHGDARGVDVIVGAERRLDRGGGPGLWRRTASGGVGTGVQPLLARGPGQGEDHGRHRTGPCHLPGGRAAARRLAGGLGRARPGRLLPARPSLGTAGSGSTTRRCRSSPSTRPASRSRRSGPPCRSSRSAAPRHRRPRSSSTAGSAHHEVDRTHRAPDRPRPGRRGCADGMRWRAHRPSPRRFRPQGPSSRASRLASTRRTSSSA